MTELLPVGPPATRQLPFLGFATDAESRKALGMAAAACGWAAPDIREGGIEAAEAHLAAAPMAALLVLDLSDCPAPLGAVDALAELCPPETRVIAIGTRNDVALYRGLRAIGVADYLLKPLDPGSLADAIRAALAEGATPATAGAVREGKGDVIAFIGARGGVGSTALAIAAAHLLATGREGPAPVILLDLDLQGGTVALDLDTPPAEGLAAILASPDRVDDMLLESAASTHALGFRMLAAEEPTERQLKVQPESVQALLAALAAAHDAVVVDLPRRLDRAVRSVLRTADRVVVVTAPTLAGLRDARRLSAFLAGIRAGQRPVVVLNRAGAAPGQVPLADFEAALGGPVDLVVPEMPLVARQAAGAATAFSAVAGGREAEVLSGLARLLAPAAGPGAAGTAVRARRAGLLERLLGWTSGQG